MAQSRSVSVAKGRGNINHNNRDFITPNVDPKRSNCNVIYKQERLEEAYEKCFGQAITDYNFLQKRKDRKINNYMDHIRNSKNGEKLFYENVVQVGNKFDTAIGSDTGQIAAQILDKYMRCFQDRNPNLYVFNAVLHLDESTPHLHIDYIPIATDYEKGMQIRNSLDKALKQQGIDGKTSRFENATQNWQEREKVAISNIMCEYGLERSPDRGLHEKHKTVDQYKSLVRQVRQEVKAIPKQIEATPTLLDKNKSTVYKSDLDSLEKRAKLSLVHEKQSVELLKQEKEAIQRVSNKEKELSQRELSLKQKSEKIEDMKFELHNRIEMQKTLNQDYNNLTNKYNNLVAKFNSLVHDNQFLQTQISQLKQQIEEKVNDAVKPLFANIQSLTNRLQSMVETIVSITKAVGMFKYDKCEYKVNLSRKQGDLIDAIAEYSKYWIEKDGGKDVDVEMYKTDIDKNVGITDGLASLLKPEYKEIIYYKGELGYGFYASKAEGGAYLGGKADLSLLKDSFPNAIFRDPYEHVPDLSRNNHISL